MMMMMTMMMMMMMMMYLVDEGPEGDGPGVDEEVDGRARAHEARGLGGRELRGLQQQALAGRRPAHDVIHAVDLRWHYHHHASV
jgi:hypothetical protein